MRVGTLTSAPRPMATPLRTAGLHAYRTPLAQVRGSARVRVRVRV